ncbi:MAG: hypothetical protein ABSB80_09170 [Methanoregula sp.]
MLLDIQLADFEEQRLIIHQEHMDRLPGRPGECYIRWRATGCTVIRCSGAGACMNGTIVIS